MLASFLKRTFTLFVAINLFITFSLVASGQSRLKNLGTLGTSTNGFGYSEATGINAKGQVCGTSRYYDANGRDLGDRAFLYAECSPDSPNYTGDVPDPGVRDSQGLNCSTSAGD